MINRFSKLRKDVVRFVKEFRMEPSEIDMMQDIMKMLSVTNAMLGQ